MPDALTDDQIRAAADYLDAAANAGPPYAPIPDAYRPRTADDGGRIFAERWARAPQPAIAWKAAVLDGDMVLAPFFDGMLIDSPGALSGTDFTNCIVEAEVAFRMARSFPPTTPPAAPTTSSTASAPPTS